MPNNLSAELLAQIFAQESDDPYLALVTLSHPDLTTIRLVNNSVDIESRGNTFQAFPMKLKFPVDDGESAKEFTIEFDNVSLELIEEIRSVTTGISVTIEMILASMPDVVQYSQDELVIFSVNYNASRIVAKIILDNFLNTEMTSEKYAPNNFPGLF